MTTQGPPPRRSSARVMLLLPREPVYIATQPSSALTATQLDEIWSVTTRYVETVRPIFEKKLRDLPEIGLFRTESGTLVGTTSFDVRRVEHAGRRSTVIYTSSVVVDERYRRQNLPMRLGLQLFLRVKRSRPLERVDWMFDTFSYKSYVLLARNFDEYWPRVDKPTPPDAAGYIDFLSRHRYGDAWDPSSGVVMRSGTKRLKPGTAPIDDALRADPAVRFFDTVNAGHREGDMLVCLCPLSFSNWVAAARNFARRQQTARSRGRNIKRASAGGSAGASVGVRVRAGPTSTSTSTREGLK